MDESLSSSGVTEPGFFSYVISVIKILIVISLPIGVFIWWKTRDDRRREQEKRAQQQFNLILTQEKQRQNRQSS